MWVWELGAQSAELKGEAFANVPCYFQEWGNIMALKLILIMSPLNIGK